MKLLPLLLLSLTACTSHDAVLRTKEAEARAATEEAARQVKGAGDALGSEGAAAAKAVGEGAGRALGDVVRGLEEGLAGIDLEVAPALAAAKVKIERGLRHESRRPAIKLYLVTEGPFQGTLQAQAKDRSGREVGRARAAIDEPEATGKWVILEFDRLVDLDLASSYAISLAAAAVTSRGN